MEVGTTPSIAHDLPSGELGPLASPSNSPCRFICCVPDVFIVHENLKCFQNQCLLPYSKCELVMTGTGQIQKLETQKGQSHRMNQVVELILFAHLALFSLQDAVTTLVPPE